MATKSTDHTIITLSVCGILIFLTWKLWPALSKLLTPQAASGNDSSGQTTASGYGYDPYEDQNQQPSWLNSLMQALATAFGGKSGISGGLGGGQGSQTPSLGGTGTTSNEYADFGSSYDLLDSEEAADWSDIDNMSTNFDDAGLDNITISPYSPDDYDGSILTDASLDNSVDGTTISDYDPSEFETTTNVSDDFSDDGGDDGGDD